MREIFPHLWFWPTQSFRKELLNRFEIASFQIILSAFIANYFSLIEGFLRQKGNPFISCFWLGMCLLLDWDPFDLNLDI